ncbi:MAG: hypothetical protein QF415_15150 [Candidatus Undinarchaeales archaeon]|nr:hypothetical protein [Candidatus Undinarchaeales archaeon]
MTDAKPKIDKKLIDDVLDIIKAHPLEVDLKVSKKEFVNVMLDELLNAKEELNEVSRLLRNKGMAVELYSRGVSLIRIGRNSDSLAMGILGIENVSINNKIKLVQTLNEIRP